MSEEMVILANEPGRQVIAALCDAALKVGGLRNLDTVTNVLKSIRPIGMMKLVKDDTDGKVQRISEESVSEGEEGGDNEAPVRGVANQEDDGA